MPIYGTWALLPLPEPALRSGQQQQVFWLYLGVPYTAAFPSGGKGIHLWGGGVHGMGCFIH